MTDLMNSVFRSINALSPNVFLKRKAFESWGPTKIIGTTTVESLKLYIDSLKKLSESNSRGVSNFGGKVVALTRFADTVIPLLSEAQRREVLALFRLQIEEAMSMTDDMPMPPEYHAALLKQTNWLLESLERSDRLQD